LTDPDPDHFPAWVYLVIYLETAWKTPLKHTPEISKPREHLFTAIAQPMRSPLPHVNVA
jgi:hypothetical protein